MMEKKWLLLEKYIILDYVMRFFPRRIRNIARYNDHSPILQFPKIDNFFLEGRPPPKLPSEGEESEILKATKKEISTRPTAYSQCERQIARGETTFRVKAHIARRDRGEINKPGGGRETRLAEGPRIMSRFLSARTRSSYIAKHTPDRRRGRSWSPFTARLVSNFHSHHRVSSDVASGMNLFAFICYR